MSLQNSDQSSNILETTDHSITSKSNWNGIEVVIKQSLRAQEPHSKERWHREVRMLKEVKDKSNCFPQILDSDADTHRIILRYETGVGLDKCIDVTACSILSKGSCHRLWTQMADGLSFLHSKSLMHDDVKPENIVWDEGKQQGVLIDFGAAHDVVAGSFDLSGTPCYIAPEYLRKLRSEKYDIWALGVTMAFTLRYIRLPDGEWFLPGVFEDSSELAKMQDWIDKILSLRQELLHAQPLLASMLDKEPATRITAMNLVHSLNNQI